MISRIVHILLKRLCYSSYSPCLLSLVSLYTCHCDHEADLFFYQGKPCRLIRIGECSEGVNSISQADRWGFELKLSKHQRAPLSHS